MVKELDSEKVKEVREQQRKRAKYFGHEGEEERLKMLQQMKSMLINHEARWLSALKKDLGKPAMESYASEIALLLNQLDYVMNHLSTWMKPATKKRLLLSGKETTVLTAEPFGSVLVFSPWNYPLQLALMPVIGALAAGNGVVLKPSEFAPAVSHLLNELVVEYFPKEVFFVIEGNSAVAQALTNMEWDFIFFTGSQTVGKKVYQAAAQHLTPVVMELGGQKSLHCG
ncbi:MAG TPA: aldehyde dehydrogenase family protein [Atopostipes sp.]|nr:aldehyde dehydrogenase family protein [Atopostipes sp.]